MQFSRTQGVALEVTSYKVSVSASASFNVCSIVVCLIASGLSPAFPPTSDDFEASYAVALSRDSWGGGDTSPLKTTACKSTDCGVAIVR